MQISPYLNLLEVLEGDPVSLNFWHILRPKSIIDIFQPEGVLKALEPKLTGVFSVSIGIAEQITWQKRPHHAYFFLQINDLIKQHPKFVPRDKNDSGRSPDQLCQ